MRLIRCCAPFLAALSFFLAAPSSTDVIFHFDGVCDMVSNTPFGEESDLFLARRS